MHALFGEKSVGLGCKSKALRAMRTLYTGLAYYNALKLGDSLHRYRQKCTRKRARTTLPAKQNRPMIKVGKWFYKLDTLTLPLQHHRSITNMYYRSN